MVPIILGAVLGVTAEAWVIFHFARKGWKKPGAKLTGSNTTPREAGLICALVLLFGAISGASVGFGVSSILPAPPRQTEERVVVETLLPFPKNTETDPTIYGVRDYNNFVRVRYNDGTSVKIGLCCDQRAAPRIVETKGDPSIKMYHRPGYRGWFSLRREKTWYEIHVPRQTVVPTHMYEVHIEILR